MFFIFYIPKTKLIEELIKDNIKYTAFMSINLVVQVNPRDIIDMIKKYS